MSGKLSKVLLSVGTNLGNRERNILDAYALLKNTDIISQSIISSIYETEPVGELDQPWFFNAVIFGETSFKPLELLNLLKSIEYFVGRQNRKRWRERELDLDIIFYEDIVCSSKYLELPHPRMHKRNFVLMPANEISPKLIHPIMNKSIRELLRYSEDKSKIKKL